MRAALLLTTLCALVALAEACKDGITPDCTSDPTVCAPIVGDAAPVDEASTPDDSGVDASDDAADADADADAADAADSSG